MMSNEWFWLIFGVSMLEVFAGSGVVFFSALCGWLLSHRWKARNYRLAVTSDRALWNSGVQQWAEKVIDKMVKIHCQFNSAEHSVAVLHSKSLALELSILIEQGRLYFPNVMRDRYGGGKQASRRGYRNAVLDPLVAAVAVAEGTVPEFDIPDVESKYGGNKCSKAVRLYLDVFLSLIESVLLVQSSNQRLVARLDDIGEREDAKKLSSFLCPENAGGPIPPGHRYWLGQEGGAELPGEHAIFRTQQEWQRSCDEEVTS